MNPSTQMALESQNPWWFSKSFNTGINRLHMFPEIMQYLIAKEVLILTGARRTGKSTIVYQIIDHLLHSGTEKENILYFIIRLELLNTLTIP
ncbi:AAA family ATPase [Methanoplanus endosymbiosus]|uniref:AAA family ATPase n=1 Tax=Methanoplanus endosymbiosus TaxID=33865 RepID=A0A9E7TKY5_9EURY|nr:AAA family ATPase [Methanoplanus endosymbiosus]UUX93135.1 AAA family ATPase [Methanoplanus endosymbiosus]